MNCRKFLYLLVLLTSAGVAAQYQQLYDTDYLPQSLLLNPGNKVDFDKHFGIPLLSGVGVQAATRNVSVYDIFQVSERDEIKERIWAKVDQLSNRDYAVLHQSLEILSAGFRTRKGNYVSFGWYEELDAITYFPKDVATLAYEGNQQHLGYAFKASDIKARAEMVSVFHIGMNKKVNEHFSIGGRFKLYSGMFSAESTHNSGTFTTYLTPDGNNYYEHRLENINGGLKIAGIGSFEEVSESQILQNSVFGGNYGVGIDLGFSYDFNERWSASGSLLDLGFINYRSKTYEYYGNGDFDFDGIEFIFPSVVDENTVIRPYWTDLEEEFNENMNFGERADVSYTLLRPVKLLGGLIYSFGERLKCNCLNPEENRYRFKTGLQAMVIKRPGGIQAGLTAFLDAPVTSFLNTKLTYGIDSFTYTNVGFLISAKIRSFNVYLAADNLLSYSNIADSNTASFQIGFQLISNTK
ncbi:MAG: DUF5723 family protein [Leeuwenhoekiella sp.]|uniref:DUF5723 family protein n=1 Tax=Leeuwenhoekiella TaxID=283735 RepID=UPI002352907A|nr:DUF5723 family protein [Leeuwenhoekiella blandensis]